MMRLERSGDTAVRGKEKTKAGGGDTQPTGSRQEEEFAFGNRQDPTSLLRPPYQLDDAP